MSIGRYLQELRFENNMSVVDVAFKAKISIGSIRAYEQGRRQPSAKSLKALLSALGVTESFWLDAVSWRNPKDGVVYDLAPVGGGWPKDRKTSAYHARDPIVQLSKIRIEAIKAILLADAKTLKAVVTILESSSQE